MQFIITALGSYGDVHPMVGLGAALAARGHRVKIVTNPYFADVVTGAGLELLPVGTRDGYVALSSHPDLWHPIRGTALVLHWTCVNMLRPLYEIVSSNYVPGETVFCAHSIDVASRTAAEKFGAPVAAVDFAPGLFWSVHDSPRMSGTLLGPHTPQWVKRCQYWVSDTLFAGWIMSGPVNRFRRELGLPPARRFFSRWFHQVDLVLAMFPDWFAQPQPDWPQHTRLVGFPLWDSPAGSVPIFPSTAAPLDERQRKMGTDPFSLSDEVRDFIESETPPIAFSPGSSNHVARPFFAAAVEACERLGRRGILLTKYADQVPTNLPASVRHFGFVPMSRLLPRTAALVHHGGIGSCAQGLAAGVPQLVRPMAYDQFDNSRRVVRLGVAEELSVRRFRGPAVSAAIQRLLDSPDVRDKCRIYAARCDGPAALAKACDALEHLAESHAAR